MCYEYIDSWKNITKNFLPAKEKLFSNLRRKKYQMDGTDMRKKYGTI